MRWEAARDRIVEGSFFLPTDDEAELHRRRDIVELMMRRSIRNRKASKRPGLELELILASEGIDPDSFQAETIAAVYQRMRILCGELLNPSPASLAA